MEYTYSSTNFRNYEKKIIWVIKEKNLHKFVLPWCSEMNIGETWSFSLLGTWSTKKNRRIGKKSVPQTACLLSVVDKYTAELSFGSSRNTLSRRAQISAEICIKLFTRRRIKCRDRRRCFSISLNFHQAILEPSPQTRFMFDIKKLLFMNALTFYSQRNTELDQFAQIPLNSQSMQVTLLITAKQKVHYDLQHCITPPTQFVIVSLCCVSLRHEIKLLQHSFS